MRGGGGGGGCHQSKRMRPLPFTARRDVTPLFFSRSLLLVLFFVCVRSTVPTKVAYSIEKRRKTFFLTNNLPTFWPIGVGTHKTATQHKSSFQRPDHPSHSLKSDAVSFLLVSRISLKLFLVAQSASTVSIGSRIDYRAPLHRWISFLLQNRLKATARRTVLCGTRKM